MTVITLLHNLQKYFISFPFIYKKKVILKIGTLCVLHGSSVTPLILLVLRNMLPHLLRANFIIETPVTLDSKHMLLQHAAHLQTFLLKQTGFLLHTVHRNIHTQ
jgi:hypothetical protein